MDFINKMRKREYIEMGLKTAIGILLGIIVIFFMEFMIYKIHINAAINNEELKGSNPSQTIYYVEKDGNAYDVFAKLTATGKNGKKVVQWIRYANDMPKARLEELSKEAGELRGTHPTLYQITADMPEGTADEVYVEENGATPYNLVFSIVSEDANHFDGATFSIAFKENASDANFTASNEYKNLTYTELCALFAEAGDMGRGADIINHIPNAFDISISGVHYVVMSLFLVVIAGVFVWRFMLIKKEYDKIEKRYKKTGKVFKG